MRKLFVSSLKFVLQSTHSAILQLFQDKLSIPRFNGIPSCNISSVWPEEKTILYYYQVYLNSSANFLLFFTYLLDFFFVNVLFKKLNYLSPSWIIFYPDSSRQLSASNQTKLQKAISQESNQKTWVSDIFCEFAMQHSNCLKASSFT